MSTISMPRILEDERGLFDDRERSMMREVGVTVEPVSPLPTDTFRIRCLEIIARAKAEGSSATGSDLWIGTDMTWRDTVRIPKEIHEVAHQAVLEMSQKQRYQLVALWHERNAGS